MTDHGTSAPSCRAKRDTYCGLQLETSEEGRFLPGPDKALRTSHCPSASPSLSLPFRTSLLLYPCPPPSPKSARARASPALRVIFMLARRRAHAAVK
eukprot:6192821-Pleurochrysis_carterae.AAC.1